MMLLISDVDRSTTLGRLNKESYTHWSAIILFYTTALEKKPNDTKKQQLFPKVQISDEIQYFLKKIKAKKCIF
jgi:hypothetical protein